MGFLKTQILYFASSLCCLIIISGCRQFFGDAAEPESIVEVPTETSQIIITSPEHGDILKPGDVLNIKWLAVSINRIDIELYRKSSYQFTIAENTESTGSFDWSIPGNINLSNHYFVKIINHNNSNTCEFSGRFGIQ